MRRIERERARFNFRNTDAMFRAGQVFREHQVARRFDRHILYGQITLAHFQRGFY